jgi:Family of unknown function (DUF6519)
MKADFTRNTFSPLKHFTRVLMQQGRVQLDADWNEQAAIQLRYLRALAADVIGEHGGPAAYWGFAITELQLTPPVHADFRIGAGHYYVDGILCEVDSTSVPIVVQSGNVVQVSSWTVDGIQFQAEQYVEVSDDVPASAFPPTLVQVKSPDQARRTLTLQGAPPNLANATAPHIRHVVTDGGWLSLEDGVQIQFQPGLPAHRYRTGDYWLIPARMATADVEWPTEPAKDTSGNPVTVPIALPPAGVQHHYAPLALVTVDNGTITSPPNDCREKFATLVERTCRRNKV